ncbi:(S)-ureidoglycine aminohydrolase [Sulfitobacter mediterraneus]|uniref:bifunctional allantoicase/(S)-ureidoglycine aminohydrolase n=1 Tax=Sulfitobacter mediterraneus TaxID=83219 RepID=UPI00193451E0|nr:bifunctional allantoicase/(S)-ureidoglycine aminohydrolase [Sulfitobacter mediterraneus]MBM1308977.1 (S)-ureidoglycine aminohydrolase [Sulfitobacter mediterraneus]MBM1312862.1 (S)-ureidoglycine aminohydrolase [Sulfitobacter mediterraneus]MBM1321244.1 (S)-ureidoglycine aminohydrolase [Sulfitobacter mediterraneus]MBM1325131.1 (S)-ureidoglycine aminohydrolase [Sulfitobacter mediterraneus]MBM1396478.1 (S)-ureidoglycine aminohydrolase [Sulfitobacter mediterraneus]
MTYAFPPGGLPDQSVNPEGAAIFTEAYAVIPAATQRDIVTSFLPGWKGMRMWVLARPLSGFAETFSQYAVELTSGGGSDAPEVDDEAQSVILVTSGQLTLNIDGKTHKLIEGGYAYLPPDTVWTLWNDGADLCKFHWVRKCYVVADGVDMPTAFVTSDKDVAPIEMPDCDGVWATTRFVDPADLRHDMHVNIVTFKPGGRIPFAETHVMEHGLYVLQGTADYLLNKDWVPVGPGDFMWLRAFCPQACIATGKEPFRYLLYKDVNRHMPL